MTPLKPTYRPVSAENWQDLEELFESRGGPHHCWCMVWRHMQEGTDRRNKADKKSSLKKYVDREIPIGLLCYIDDRPIAWCSIAPRRHYRNLQHKEDLQQDVWSLVCFFIRREFRGQGISRLLTEAALAYAKSQGAKYVEAYPVDPSSPSYRFMGFKPTFDKLGFACKGRAGQRRYVMLKKL
jgi:GNAT superfamily N-acetyltransferase